MTNDRICPEDMLRVLLPAEKLPDRAAVYKRTGETPYTLRRDLLVYQYGNKADPIKITGYFLVGVDGSITQIQPDHVLHWAICVENFVDEMKQSWDKQEHDQ